MVNDLWIIWVFGIENYFRIVKGFWLFIEKLCYLLLKVIYMVSDYWIVNVFGDGIWF